MGGGTGSHLRALGSGAGAACAALGAAGGRAAAALSCPPSPHPPRTPHHHHHPTPPYPHSPSLRQVDKVKEATRLVKEQRPELFVEGEAAKLMETDGNILCGAVLKMYV